MSTNVEDNYKQLQTRVDSGDYRAMYDLGVQLTKEPSTIEKTKELLLKSAESGYPLANRVVGIFHYDGGEGGEYPAIFPKDRKKARHFFEVGAIGGDPIARRWLAHMELDEVNAQKHAMMSASCGHKDALDVVQNGFKRGLVSKEDFARTLRAYKKASDEITGGHRAKEKNPFGVGSGFPGVPDDIEFPQMKKILECLEKLTSYEEEADQGRGKRGSSNKSKQ
jgi:TPR repeat protein